MEISPYLATLLSAMTPVGELRLAIPLGVYQYNLSWYEAMTWSLIGNLIPVLPLLWGTNKLGNRLLMSTHIIGRLVRWRQVQLVTSHGNRFRRFGAWALIPLVAIPLPLTGAWTGCLAAWIFGIPHRQAFISIFIGVILSATIVTLLVQFSIHFVFLPTN